MGARFAERLRCWGCLLMLLQGCSGGGTATPAATGANVFHIYGNVAVPAGLAGPLGIKFKRPTPWIDVLVRAADTGTVIGTAQANANGSYDLAVPQSNGKEEVLLVTTT